MVAPDIPVTRCVGGRAASRLARRFKSDRWHIGIQAPPAPGIYHGDPAVFFDSWETSQGAFGFTIEGEGVEFVGPVEGIAPLQVVTREAFTDFAISKPWLFQRLPGLERTASCFYRIMASTTRSSRAS